MSKQIQWFPGHMAKARREISEKIKLIDIIIELVDARAPKSSKNPMFDDICQNKPRLIVMTKKDLADEKLTQKWLQYYQSKGMYALSVNLKNFNEYQLVINTCKEILKEKMEKEAKRGLKPRAMRAMVLGIPNVGKSTLINRVAKKKAVVAADRPGVTRTLQWVKINKDLELLDTPGVLWPKFGDENVGLCLGISGAIRDEILPMEEIFMFGLKYCMEYYPQYLISRYEIELSDDPLENLRRIARKRGCIKTANELDEEKVMNLFIREARDGLIGRISWERSDGNSE